MEHFTLTLVITLGIVLYIFLIAIMISIFAWSERERKKEDRKMSSFLRHMHLASVKNHRDSQRTLAEIQKTNRDNAIYLRRIHEIVDDPE
jgi:hypothetical protein